MNLVKYTHGHVTSHVYYGTDFVKVHTHILNILSLNELDEIHTCKCVTNNVHYGITFVKVHTHTEHFIIEWTWWSTYMDMWPAMYYNRTNRLWRYMHALNVSSLDELGEVRVIHVDMWPTMYIMEWTLWRYTHKHMLNTASLNELYVTHKHVMLNTASLNELCVTHKHVMLNTASLNELCVVAGQLQVAQQAAKQSHNEAEQLRSEYPLLSVNMATFYFPPFLVLWAWRALTWKTCPRTVTSYYSKQRNRWHCKSRQEHDAAR